jgi:hypothetical protein
MVMTLRASRALCAAALLAVGCTVSSEGPQPLPNPWDAATEGGSSGGGSGSGAGSSGSSSGFASLDGNACQPGSVATYHPDMYHAASGAWQGACVPGPAGDPIGAFFDACLGPNATTDQCNAVRQANAACVSCILTPDSARSYGPLIDHGSFVSANVAGCLELLVPAALSCAKAVQALDECEQAACKANCPVHDAASLTDYETCATQTESGGCQTYATAANCAITEPDAAPKAAVCLGDFQSFYSAVVPVFCGPPQGSDAGPGMPADASGD